MKQTVAKKLALHLWACAFVAIVLSPHQVFSDNGNEYRLKAALALNLARFTTWPDDNINYKNGILRLCVFGDDRVQKAFSSINARSLGKRIVKTRELDNPVHANECDVLFYSGKNRALLARIITAVGHSPTLTIGEMSGFTHAGGIINMVNKNNKIQFEIDQRNIKKSGLSVSSRLLKLCTIIDD